MSEWRAWKRSQLTAKGSISKRGMHLEYRRAIRSSGVASKRRVRCMDSYRSRSPSTAPCCCGGGAYWRRLRCVVELARAGLHRASEQRGRPRRQSQRVGRHRDGAASMQPKSKRPARRRWACENARLIAGIKVVSSELRSAPTEGTRGPISLLVATRRWRRRLLGPTLLFCPD